MSRRMTSISRRALLGASALAGAAPAAAAGPPVVIASENGHVHKNGGPQTCVERVFQMLIQGRDPLDAVVEGVGIVELDPADTSVGFGGLPNGDGVVQLDASVMDGRRRQAGAVAALEGVRTPAAVARLVARNTDHHLLMGAGAQSFARRMGFRIEDDLNTPESRRLWLEWKRRTDPEHYLDPDRRSEAAEAARRSMVRDGLVDPHHLYGTIHCSAINGAADLACVTTTSGLAWKIPGRVGDSPILGAGLYLDNGVGSAGSTGRGEANLFNLSSYLAVERMRAGDHPKDAAAYAVRRIVSNTVEKRLLNEQGRPNFNVVFYLLDKQGRHAGVALYGGRKYAVCDGDGARLVELEGVLPGVPGG